MSHHVYQTEALILNQWPGGEANLRYAVLTRDFGLIHAAAQGVRLLQSKLRYELQPYRLITMGLVRGREIWRVVGAETLDDFSIFMDSEEGQCFWRSVFGLIQRLIHGEERNSALFIDLQQGLLVARQALKQADAWLLEPLALLLQLKILRHLGYWKPDETLSVFVENQEMDLALSVRFKVHSQRAQLALQAALEASHLA